MYKLLFICFLLLISSLVYSQFSEDAFYVNIVPIKIKSNYQLGRNFNNYLKTNLKTDYNIASKSSIILKSNVNTDAAYRIEGMDTRVVGNPRIVITVKEMFTKRDTNFIFEPKISANNKREMTTLLINKFMNEEKVIEQFKNLMTDFVSKIYGSNCGTVIDKTNILLENKKYDEALRLISNLLPIALCHDKAQIQKGNILKQYGNDVCDTKIQKVTVMVNSGITFQLNRAVRILLTIPPNSICAGEALRLSNEIGKQNSLNQESTKILHQYENYHTSNVSLWQAYYLEEIFK